MLWYRSILKPEYVYLFGVVVGFAANAAVVATCYSYVL